jgi:hypothetical protein
MVVSNQKEINLIFILVFGFKKLTKGENGTLQAFKIAQKDSEIKLR